MPAKTSGESEDDVVREPPRHVACRPYSYLGGIMGPVRPTLRVLSSMPTSASVAQARAILARARAAADDATKRQILGELSICDIESALIDDAQHGFDHGAPSRHEESTKTYGDTVYEVRDPAGAGWRGAVILDGDGDPWLVYADRHDHFHANASSVLRRSKGKGAPPPAFLPTPLDYELRTAEEDRQRKLEAMRELIRGLRDGLRKANATGHVVSVRTPEHPQETAAEKTILYTVDVDHEEPAETVEEANLSTSIVTVTMPMNSGSPKMRELLISCGVVYIQPDAAYRDPVWTPTSDLLVVMTVTHAKLAQLLSDVDVDANDLPPTVTPPDRLHWVRSEDQIEGMVNGAAVSSLCGHWFVPSKSESAELPVCGSCEAIKPLAQELMDQLRLMGHR